jgi:hypothetical protein
VSEKLVWWIVGIVAVLLLGAALWGPIVSNVEHPKFKAAERSGNIEIRDYAPMIVAEAEVKGERREAISEGFRIIADYIFGNNTAAQNVPMTAPVTQQGSEKIAMTAPVTQQGGGSTWRVRFIMPESLKRYNKELNDFLSAKRLTPLSLLTYAFHNPPWTLPFLRRNEVLVEIAGPAN